MATSDYPLLSLPLKPTEGADPGRALRGYIQKQYDEDTAKQHDQSLAQLTDLRKKAAACGELPLVAELVSDRVLPYVAALNHAAQHFPMENTAGLNLHFTWTDALERKPRKLRKPSAYADLVGFLFNAAAVHSEIGRAHPQGTEGIKAAYKSFQVAAGMVEYTEVQLAPRLLGDTTPDTTSAGLAFVKALLLAQAHHCAYMLQEATNRDKLSLLARLANEGQLFYAEVQGLLSQPALEGLDGRYGLFCSVSRNVLLAKAHMHMALDFQAKMDKVGEGLARARAAEGLLGRSAEVLKKAGRKSGLQGDFAGYVAAMQRRAADLSATLQKENNTVYHDKIPDQLPDIDKLKRLGSAELPDLSATAKETGYSAAFTTLVPLELKREVDEYKQHAQELIQNTEQQAREAGEVQRGKMTELGVMGILATLEQQDGGAKAEQLPQSLRERIARVQGEVGQEGCFPHLKGVLTILQGLNSSCTAKLGDCEGALAEELKADRAMRDKHGTQWKRPVSESLPDYQRFKGACEDYKGKLEAATKGDSTIAERLGAAQQKLCQLDCPVADLDALVASKAGGTAQSVSAGVKEAGAQLAASVATFDAAQTEAAELLEALKALPGGDAVEERLLAARKEAPDDAEARKAALSSGFEAYVTKQEEIEKKAKASEEAMEAVEAAVLGVKALQASGEQLVGERERAINELDEACNKFSELSANVKEGKNFYNSVANWCDELHQNIRGYTAARELEREDHARQLADHQHREQQERQDAAEAQRIKEEQELRAAAAASAPPPAALRPGFVTGAGAMVRAGEALDSAVVTQVPLPSGTALQVAEVRGRRARIISPVSGWVSIATSDGQELVRIGEGAPGGPAAAAPSYAPSAQPAVAAQWRPSVAPPAGVAAAPSAVPALAPQRNPYAPRPANPYAAQAPGAGGPAAPAAANPYGQHPPQQPQRGGYSAYPSRFAQPAAAAPSYAAAPPGGWACPRCTFHNAGSAAACAMCNAPRPSTD